MAIKHQQLGAILGWKHNHEPGITTKNGELMSWPSSLGTRPSDAQQQQWITEYEALPVDDETRDRRAALRKAVQAANSVADLKAIILKLIE